MGTNRIPVMSSVGSTVLGVRIGCQAFNRCCLNAVSGGHDYGSGRGTCRMIVRLTCRSPPAPLLLLGSAISITITPVLDTIEERHRTIVYRENDEGKVEEESLGTAQLRGRRHRLSLAVHADVITYAARRHALRPRSWVGELNSESDTKQFPHV